MNRDGPSDYKSMHGSRTPLPLSIGKERHLTQGLPLLLSLFLHGCALVLIIGMFGFGLFRPQQSSGLPPQPIDIELVTADVPHDVAAATPLTPETASPVPAPLHPQNPAKNPAKDQTLVAASSHQSVIKPASGPAASRPDSGAPLPQASSSSGLVASSSYAEIIASHIAHYRFYPLPARQRHEEGKVIIRIVVAHNGNLESSAILQTSGSHLLDSAALSTVKRASPYPQPPQGRYTTLMVPVTYSLK